MLDADIKVSFWRAIKLGQSKGKRWKGGRISQRQRISFSDLIRKVRKEKELEIFLDILSSL